MFGPISCYYQLDVHFIRLSHIFWVPEVKNNETLSFVYNTKHITFQTSNKITALAPSKFGLSILDTRDENSSVFHSITRPVQKKRRMRGAEVKEQNIIVTRPFSCHRVSEVQRKSDAEKRYMPVPRKRGETRKEMDIP